MFDSIFSKTKASSLKKYTKFIIAFVVILVIVGGYFLWLPKYQEYNANNEDLNKEGERTKKKKEYLYELEGHLNGLAEYQEKLDKINSAIPIKYSPASLYSFVQKATGENGLALLAADFSEGGAKSDKEESLSSGLKINQIGISISTSGEYESLKNLLSTIYRTSRLIDINSLSFSSTTSEDIEEGPPTGIFDFELQLGCNYYLEQKPAEEILITNP
jgi:Tfp pilus assembly protein PilO